MIAHASPNLQAGIWFSDIDMPEVKPESELVADTNAHCCLTGLIAGSIVADTWIEELAVVGTQVRHECVQISTLRQPVVSAQVDLGQLAFCCINIINTGLLNAAQQFQRWIQGIGRTQFKDVGLVVVAAADGKHLGRPCAVAVVGSQNRVSVNCSGCRLLDAGPVTIQTGGAQLIGSSQCERLQDRRAVLTVGTDGADQGSIAGSRAGLGLVVASTQTQRTVGVQAADTKRLTCSIFASLFTETVHQGTNEATQVRCIIADRVVGTRTFQTIQIVADCAGDTAEISDRSQGAADIVQNVGLTAQQNSTETARQTNDRLATEQNAVFI